jgi:hypothetical protein
MKRDLKWLIQRLKELLPLFHSNSSNEKEELIKLISKKELMVKSLLQYHEILLFMLAYTSHHGFSQLITRELNRIANFIKQLPKHQQEFLFDSGLPYTKMITRFSCDILPEMIHKYDCKIEIDSFEEDGTALNTLLQLTLPNILKQETTAGLDNLALLDTLGVKPKHRLSFLLDEFNKLEKIPLIKDHLWESMKIYLDISANSKNYSRSFNCIECPHIFYHDNLLKKFDYLLLLKKPLPQPAVLNETSLTQVIASIRKSLLLTMRETDTSTYMEESSLQLYHLERGVSIALYSLKANRQLAYQSYVGYTAFKNGFPVAYGGSWVFGESAMFGLNILETFRGGESGFLMCQLLRTYLQRFQLNYIEVENYQFGKDNPDGIKSGAFWFYYRYGFRPVDPKLELLAQKEFDKIKKQEGYRSSEKVLMALSESNIALKMTNKVPVKKEQIFTKVLNMIATEFGGDNRSAIKTSVDEFKQKLGLKTFKFDVDHEVLEEVALWARAFKIKDNKKLKVLYKMIGVKAKDSFTYNQLIKDFLAA